MLPITNSTNKISHTLNNNADTSPDEKENDIPSDVLARLKRLAEERVESLKKRLDILDAKIPTIEKEVQNRTQRAEDIEKYLRATVGDCKITSDGHLTPSKLAEISEQRIIVNETLMKACEARKLIGFAQYKMTNEILKLSTGSSLEKELQYGDAKTRDLLMQRSDVYDNMLPMNFKNAVANRYCLGRNVYFIEENIRGIQIDAKKIMNLVDSEDKEEWKERLLLCDKHLSIIKDNEWDKSKKQWLQDCERKGFQATYII